MNLLEQYKVLLTAYDKTLSLSEMILTELEKKDSESNLMILLEQKKAVGENISHLAETIAATEIKSRTDPNLKTLAEVKGILVQISEKAKQIQKVEERIQNFLKVNGQGSE